MAHAIPSPSPRTLRRVGRLQYLVLRPDLHGPAVSQGVDNSGGRRAVPSRLRWHDGASQLRYLLALGFYGNAADAR